MTPNDDAVSIELIKKTFTSKHFSDLFAGESTHNAARASCSASAFHRR